MTLATCAIFFAALTYALIAAREILMWRFPDAAFSRWLEIRDPYVHALVSRHAAREAAAS